MSIELMDRLRDVIDVALDEWMRDLETETDEATYVAAAIVHNLGLEPTDTSRHNAMVKYETRWLDRSN